MFNINFCRFQLFAKRSHIGECHIIGALLEMMLDEIVDPLFVVRRCRGVPTIETVELDARVDGYA